MKNITYLTFLLLILVSCEEKSKNYATLSGKITNKNSNSITVFNQKLGLNRVIKLEEDGTFKDTMKVKAGEYNFFDGKEYTSVYLKNGADITVSIDAKEFDETITFTGKGSEENNFLAKTSLQQQAILGDRNLFSLSEEEINKKLSTLMDAFKSGLQNKEMDAGFVASQKNKIETLISKVKSVYNEKQYMAKNLAKGIESPKFVNYENYKGGNTSLEDLQGKYVYIDMWATWCQPCKNEIPYLKKVEEKFHNKNIEFVSISIDREQDYNTWKKMVADKELTGVQLYAKGDKSFSTAYRVSGIPRFILIDPAGKIVNANAPRPSNPQLVAILEALL